MVRQGENRIWGQGGLYYAKMITIPLYVRCEKEEIDDRCNEKGSIIPLASPQLRQWDG